MNVTSFRRGKLGGGSPLTPESPQSPPGLSREATMAMAEMGRERELERESTQYSVAQVFANVEVCPWLLGLLSHNPVGISSDRHRVLNRGPWPLAFFGLLRHCPQKSPQLLRHRPPEVPSAPAVSPKVPFTRHLQHAGALHPLHYSSVRLESSLFYRRGNEGLRSEIAQVPTARSSLSASTS